MRQIREQTLSKGMCSTIKPYYISYRQILLNITKGITKCCKDEHKIAVLWMFVYFQMYVTSWASDVEKCCLFDTKAN